MADNDTFFDFDNFAWVDDMTPRQDQLRREASRLLEEQKGSYAGAGTQRRTTRWKALCEDTMELKVKAGK